MNGTVLIELTHEQHYRLMEVLRISKARGGFSANPDEQRILDARRCLRLPEASRWKFHDWTPEDEKKERDEENERNRAFIEMPPRP